MIKLDSIDIRILAALQLDGGLTKARLAEQVNLSVSPCWQRVKRLEKSGIIKRYRAELDIRKLAPVTCVYVEVTLQQHLSRDFARFEQAVQDVPEVVECQAIGGGFDYLMKVAVPDIDAYQRLMDRLLEREMGIGRYFSYVVTKEVKGPAEYPLESLVGALSN